MKVAYVLLHPELGGGVKVVFQHARLLQMQGHEVSVLGCGPKPDWVQFDGTYFNYDQEQPKVGSQDLVIATYYATIPIAEAMNLGPLVHFCQGYEGDLAHLAAELPQIEAAYSRKIPALVVTPHLADFLLERFGRESRVVTPPVDFSFRPSLRFGPRECPWIFIPGIFEAEVKGVRTALEAVLELRAAGRSCKVVRSSTLPLTAEERRILEPDIYHFRLPSKELARQLRKCDLMMFPSLPMEGFGLPLLEAMVSKVPTVASRIPATEFIGNGDLTLVAPRNARAFAFEAAQILDDRHRWRKSRSLGYGATRRFHPRLVARQLAEAIHWAQEAAKS